MPSAPGTAGLVAAGCCVDRHQPAIDAVPSNRLRRQSRELPQQADEEPVKRFPYAEMAKLGWVIETRNLPERISELFNFFRVANLAQLAEIGELAPSFRKSQMMNASPDAMAAWLRRGMVAATDLSVERFKTSDVRLRLTELRNLTVTTREQPQQRLQKLYAEIGIAVVFVPHLPQTDVGGI